MSKEYLIIAVLLIALVFVIHQWFKEWLNKTILAVWIIEKHYIPPTEQDRKRIIKWILWNSFLP